MQIIMCITSQLTVPQRAPFPLVFPVFPFPCLAEGKKTHNTPTEYSESAFQTRIVFQPLNCSNETEVGNSSFLFPRRPAPPSGEERGRGSKQLSGLSEL